MVERNDNNNDIPYSSKFLWSGMLVIEMINHVIMAVLLEIRVFHLRLTLLYRGIILPSVHERCYNKQDSVAGCWFVLFSTYFLAGTCHLEIVRLGQWSKHKCRLEIRNDWLAHHLKKTTKS